MMVNIKDRSAFTLVEMLVGLAITFLIMAASALFWVESAKYSYVAEQKNLGNGLLRKVSEKISGDANRCNYFRIYPSFAVVDRDSVLDSLEDGNAGNFIAFVTLDKMYTLDSMTSKPVEKIVGYFLEENEGESTYSLKRFEQAFAPATYNALENIYPAEGDSSIKVVTDNFTGIVDNKAFLRIGKRNALINAKILQVNDKRNMTSYYTTTVSSKL